MFFEKFAYNTEDLLGLPGASLLYKILAKKELDESEIEEIKTLEVYIDENFPDKHEDVIHRQFFDLLRLLHTALLDREREKMLSNIDPASPEFLQTYTYLVRKATALGVPPGRITIS